MATVMELKARADAYGLRNYDRLNKTQLESLISKHDQLTCEQHKPIPQPVIFRFEVNELYYDNFAGFIVIERTDTHVTFKNVGSEKVSCRKVSITRTHVGYCETATLTNYNGERCYPTARPTSKTDDAFSKITREISIRKAKEAYASFLQGQCVDSVPKTTRITVMTSEQAVRAVQSATTASVIVDEIPAGHEPDVQEVNSAPVQEVNATTYEAMREAYEAYLDAEDKYLTIRKTDTAEKAKSDEAFKQYLMLLGKYRQEGMSEREEALSWIHEYCKTSVLPADKLMLNNNFDFLAELCHKCGIHSAFFKGYCNRHDMAVRLTREAGVETALKTSYEQYMGERKELQGELHKLWQKRHALLKAQRIFGEGSADAEALSDVWDEYHDQADILLGEYWRICEELSLLRERKRKYEADSQRADTLAMAEAVVSKELELQPVQIIKPKATISLKKKPHKISRKSHTPRWVQSLQVKSKASRNSPNSKPLMKPTKAASTIRVRKF